MASLQFWPMLILGPIGGVIADRFNKRRLLMLAYGVNIVISTALIAWVGAGWAHVMSKPTILWPVVIAGFVAMFCMNLPVVLVACANNVYDSGAEGYGLYSSAAAAGALAGALAEWRGVKTTMIVCGAVPTIAAIVIAILLARSGRLSLKIRWGWKIVPMKIEVS